MFGEVFGGLVALGQQERLVPVGPAGFEGSGKAVLPVSIEFQDGLFFFGGVVFITAGDRGIVPSPGEFVILEPRVSGGNVHIVGVFQVRLGDFKGQIPGVVVIVPGGAGEVTELVLVPEGGDEGIQESQVDFGGDFVGEDPGGGVDDPGAGGVPDQVDMFEAAGNRENGLGQARTCNVAGIFGGVFGIDDGGTVLPVEEAADPFVGIRPAGNLAGGVFGPVATTLVDPAMGDDHQTIAGQGKLDGTGTDDFGVGGDFGLEDKIVIKVGTCIANGKEILGGFGYLDGTFQLFFLADGSDKICQRIFGFGGFRR